MFVFIKLDFKIYFSFLLWDYVFKNIYDNMWWYMSVLLYVRMQTQNMKRTRAKNEACERDHPKNTFLVIAYLLHGL